MKSKFHKKLSFKKVTISKHNIFGGAANANNGDVTERSSAFHEPTEISEFPVYDEDLTLSGNHQTCM